MCIRDRHIAAQMGVANYGQMTAGGWMYIGPQGIVHGTFNTLLLSLIQISNSLAGFNHSKYAWLEWDEASKVGKMLHITERADIPENIKEHLIVELYSK